jgi:hypothetical protein
MKANMLFVLLLTALGQGGEPARVLAQDAPARPAVARDDKSKDSAAGTQPDLEKLKQTAASYRVVADDKVPKTMVLVAEPVLHWTNPLRQTHDGAVFIWVADGRPEVVASLYRYKTNGTTFEDHEFQSLATTGLTATRNGQQVWAPRTAGITLAPIPGAPKPASTPAERLRQMRALAHEFHAFFDVPGDRSELRLLSRPLYRYEVNRPDLKDGALFAFVVATDPEVLLVIEARPAGGASVWHYGLARMSMVNMRAQHKDRHVWSVDWVNDLAAPNKPYVTLRASERRD